MMGSGRLLLLPGYNTESLVEYKLKQPKGFIFTAFQQNLGHRLIEGGRMWFF